MADRLSKAQMEQLGKRLVAADRPASEDLVLLHEILLARSEHLEDAIARVRTELDLAPTSRVKNTGTILEKLRRQGGWTLASMQDVAGMRIVGAYDRRGQDDVVARLSGLFADGTSAPKVIDRRAAPMHGYRAVHVVVFPVGSPIEIQVRTARQHEWAELFEKLADLVGRGIRYGEPPPEWLAGKASDGVSPQLPASYGPVRDQVVEIMFLLADRIAILENAEAAEAPDLELLRRNMDLAISLGREMIADWEELHRLA